MSEVKTALLIVPVIAILLGAIPSTYADTINHFALPPGATSTTDIFTILPKGTAGGN